MLHILNSRLDLTSFILSPNHNLQLTMTKRGAKFDPSDTVSSSGLKLGFPTPLNEGGDDNLKASDLGGAGSAAVAAASKHPKTGQGKLFLINRYRRDRS